MKRFFSRHNWKGLLGMLRSAVVPWTVMQRYYRKTGSYPFELALRTPVGPISLTLYSHDDLITVHEIFFRQDYPIAFGADAGTRHVVDFGANIGIASAYFVSRAAAVRVYAYEPVPLNSERARANLVQFGDRVVLTECAVGTHDGMVSFGIETTGRYGGIGLPHADQIEVPCRTGATELAGILTQASVIDVLKLDIEEMELPILRSLDASILSHAEQIFAECDGSVVNLQGFEYEQVLTVARFCR